MRAVLRHVVRGGETRRDLAVARVQGPVGVDGVVLVITDADVEAPTVVEVPAIVDVGRLRLEIALSLLEREDRGPEEERSARRLGRGARRRRAAVDRRVEDAVRVLHAVDEEAEVRARLVVVGVPVLLEVLDAGDDVLVAPALRADEVVRLQAPATVVAGFLVAHAAERRRVVARVAIRTVADDRAAGEVGVRRSAAPADAVEQLRPRTFEKEVVRDDAVVVDRLEVDRIGAAAELGQIVRGGGEERVVRDRVVLQVRERDVVIREGLAGQLPFIALVGSGGVDVVGESAGPRNDAEAGRRIGLRLAAGAEEPQLVLDDETAEGRRVELVVEVADERVVGDLKRRARGPARAGDLIAQRSAEFVAARLRDRVDHAAGETAVLRRDRARENRRLLDRVFDVQRKLLRPDFLGDDDAVDHHGVVVTRAARDRELSARRRVGVDARSQRRRVDRRAVLDRERFHRLAGDVGRHRRRLQDAGCGRRDRDCFADAGDLQVGIGGADLRDADRHLFGDRLHSRQLELHRVCPWGNTVERVTARGACNRGARALHRRRRERHRHAR